MVLSYVRYNGTGAAQGMGYVFPATASVTDVNVNDVWMVRGPEVSKEVCVSMFQEACDLLFPLLMGGIIPCITSKPTYLLCRMS